MRVVVVECRDTKSADYWWRETLKSIDMEESVSEFLFKKYPHRHIMFSQFDLYFLSKYSMREFMLGRKIEGVMSDRTYEKIMNQFINTEEDIHFETYYNNVVNNLQEEII